MIEALYQIGKIQVGGSFLEEFIEDIGDKNKYVLKIMFDITDSENIFYNGIELEEFDPTKKMQYFYKSKKGNSPDCTPTSKVTTILKSLKLKYGVFDKMIADNGDKMSEEDKQFILSIRNLCQEKRRKIFVDIVKISKKLNICKLSYDKKNKSYDYGYKDGAVITLGFINGLKKYYVGDEKHFVNPFSTGDRSIYKDYYAKYDTNSKANDKLCYVCRNKSKEVWGFVNTYNFYTADKEGLVSGGFKQELAWKNYPVCPDCAETLNKGKKYIENNLKYRFCGFNYFLIPELCISDNILLQKVLQRMRKYEDFSFAKQESTIIEKVEEAVMRDLSREENWVNFNFLFYEAKNSAFNILLHLQEVAPTRLKYLIDTKDLVDSGKRRFDVFKDISTKKETIRFNFSFGFIREFFPNTKMEGNFDKDFLSILNNIFSGKNISAEFLFGKFMAKMVPVFLNEGWYEILILKAYKILIYI
ncbi:MAG TPA: TM1802 family CRISPR-associated protein, partial [bacterium]|nr:TM1802 family CRISPR-associated protein [bacterium]